MQSHDWIVRTADDVIAAAQERDADPIICASGISPSGPVHLGNLRELTTQHFVAEEIKRRGVACEHLLFWDDYDRLRKIPAGVPPDFAEHVGRPLTGIPDPWGEHASWAERFATPVRDAIRQLGMDIREISQTERYAAGAYTDHIVRAMRERDAIRDVLARYRTKGKERTEEEYWPYRVYCETCGRDTTSITHYDDATTALGYTCECGHTGNFVLADHNSGKLLFKVDWPMRWAAVPVTFEAAGADHSSPGSTMTVGSELCRKVFGAAPPVYLGYAFVGIRGASKLSSSAGAVPTPADGLRVIEAPILRWLYERRRPNQSITIDFGSEITRLYDEWDRLDDATAYERATRTTTAELPQPAKRIPWRLLTSVLDLTAGDDAQLLRILRDVDADSKDLALADIEPRLSRARAWVAEHVPVEARTHVREGPDNERLSTMSEREGRAVATLLERLEHDWSLVGLTTLVYGVPKLVRGMPIDAPPTAELKQDQRAFFALVYTLLVNRDTGPRLPTLLLALGPERIRRLMTYNGE